MEAELATVAFLMLHTWPVSAMAFRWLGRNLNCYRPVVSAGDLITILDRVLDVALEFLGTTWWFGHIELVLTVAMLTMFTLIQAQR